MPHEVTHELTRTVKGMKVSLKFKCPYSLSVDKAFEIGNDALDKISGLLDTEAAKDPNQADLPLDDDPPE